MGRTQPRGGAHLLEAGPIEGWKERGQSGEQDTMIDTQRDGKRGGNQERTP